MSNLFGVEGLPPGAIFLMNWTTRGEIKKPQEWESFGGFRGSQFHYTPNQPDITHGDLIQRLYKQVKSLAYQDQLFSTPQTVRGGLNSIWEGDESQWRNIVHGICSSKNKNKPAWCGSSNHRPSGYAVRQYEKSCLITVFDPEVERTLRSDSEEFRCIWQIPN